MATNSVSCIATDSGKASVGCYGNQQYQSQVFYWAVPVLYKEGNREQSLSLRRPAFAVTSRQ
jgi:hypothetical protein